MFLFALFLCFLVATPSFASSVSIAKQAQTQSQAQMQSQVQGQSQNQTAIGGTAVSNSQGGTAIASPTARVGVDYAPSVTVEKTDPVINNSFNTKTYRPYRGLPYADSPINQQAPTLFFTPEKDTGPLFVSAGMLVDLLNSAEFSEDFEKNDDIKIVVQPLRSSASIASEYEKVRFQIIDKNFKLKDSNPIAFATIISRGYVSSVGLAYKLSKVAKDYGATKVVLIKEGLIIEMRSSGKSFGLNPSVSMAGGMGLGSSIGAVGAGGLGVSKAKGYYLKLPYLQALLVN